MIYYCPKCGKLDTNFKITKDTPRVGNIRDGYGHPLYHMKCDCGNYLAAGIHFPEEELNPSLVEYVKDLITGYNKDGIFYQDGFYEYVEKRISNTEQRNREILEERKRVMDMSEVEKKEYFDKKYEEMMKRTRLEVHMNCI